MVRSAAAKSSVIGVAVVASSFSSAQSLRGGGITWTANCALCRWPCHPDRALDGALQVGFDVLDLTPGGDLLAEAVGFDPGHAGEVHGDAQHVLLEEQHAVGLADHPFQAGMPVGGGLEPLSPPQVGLHGARLDGAGADERDLVREVSQVARAHHPRGVDPARALHLEEPERGAAADQVPDPLVVRHRNEHLDRLNLN
jgi:hypothetical protein